MATTFVNLPSVAANGAGTAVDTSNFACTKTIVNGGNGYVYEPLVTIEICNDAAGVDFTPIYTFQGPGEVTLNVVARWMRTRVANYRGGGAPNVDMGADLEAAAFATIASPVGNGSGVAVATDTLPLFKTVQVVGPFRGTVNLNVSEDGVSYGPFMSFQPGGVLVQSLPVTAAFMRVERTGVPQVDPGQPTLYIAADTGPGGGGGGGGGGGIDVQDEGVDLPDNPYGTLNVSAGVKADGEDATTARIRGATGTAVLTLRPGGGVQGPEVFDDWDDLYAKLVQLRDSADSGRFTIVFDDSEDLNPSIPATGTTYDMTGCEWIGVNGATSSENGIVLVNLGTGEGDANTIIKLQKISGLKIVNVQGSPSIVLDGDDTITLLESQFGGDDGSAAITTDASGGGTPRVLVDNNTSLDVRSITSGFHWELHLIGTVSYGDVFSVKANALAGAGQCDLYLKEGSALIDLDQPGLTAPLAWLSDTGSPARSLAWPFMPEFTAPFDSEDTVTLHVGYTNRVANGVSGGQLNATLPLAADYQKGDFLVVKVVPASDAVPGVVIGNGTDLIDGQATLTLDDDYDSVILVSLGIDEWAVVGQKTAPPTSSVPASPINETWCQNEVAANQAAVGLECQVSSNFASYKALRSGSITGIGWRLTEACTTGTLTVNVAIDGAPIVLAGVTTNASNQSGGQSSQASGIATFNAGQLITVTVTTNGTFAPITTDLEVILDAVFSTPA